MLPKLKYTALFFRLWDRSRDLIMAIYLTGKERK